LKNILLFCLLLSFQLTVQGYSEIYTTDGNFMFDISNQSPNFFFGLVSASNSTELTNPYCNIIFASIAECSYTSGNLTINQSTISTLLSASYELYGSTTPKNPGFKLKSSMEKRWTSLSVAGQYNGGSSRAWTLTFNVSGYNWYNFSQNNRLALILFFFSTSDSPRIVSEYEINIDGAYMRVSKNARADTEDGMISAPSTVVFEGGDYTKPVIVFPYFMFGVSQTIQVGFPSNGFSTFTIVCLIILGLLVVGCLLAILVGLGYVAYRRYQKKQTETDSYEELDSIPSD